MIKNFKNKGMEPGDGDEIRDWWGFFKKVLMWAAVIGVVGLGLLALAGNYLDEIEQWIRDRQSARYEQALQKYVGKERARYTADTDGGKTPEETIDLFIAALKAGDIDQASKYYILEKQEATLADLKDEIAKYGSLDLSIEHFTDVSTKGIKKCNEKGDGCTFEYVYTVTETKTLPIRGRTEVIIIPAGEQSLKLIDLGLNRLSGVWKIELP